MDYNAKFGFIVNSMHFRAEQLLWTDADSIYKRIVEKSK